MCMQPSPITAASRSAFLVFCENFPRSIVSSICFFTASRYIFVVSSSSRFMSFKFIAILSDTRLAIK